MLESCHRRLRFIVYIWNQITEMKWKIKARCKQKGGRAHRGGAEAGQAGVHVGQQLVLRDGDLVRDLGRANHLGTWRHTPRREKNVIFIFFNFRQGLMHTIPLAPSRKKKLSPGRPPWPPVVQGCCTNGQLITKLSPPPQLASTAWCRDVSRGGI